MTCGKPRGFLFYFRRNPSLRYYIVAALIVPCSLTIVISRRDRQSLLRSKKDPCERLRKLDKVSPTCTLEKWWSNTKGNLGLSEAVDGQFVWYVSIAVSQGLFVDVSPALCAWNRWAARRRSGSFCACMFSTASAWKSGFWGTTITARCAIAPIT